MYDLLRTICLESPKSSDNGKNLLQECVNGSYGQMNKNIYWWVDFDPTPNCVDGILNNDEEDVDCGGPNCGPCPTCEDGEQNGGEEGVDCGGPCSFPCRNSLFFTVNERLENHLKLL